MVEAFEGLAETADEIDTDQLAQSLTTLADLTRNTPEEFRAALAASRGCRSNIAAKNDQINACSATCSASPRSSTTATTTSSS